MMSFILVEDFMKASFQSIFQQNQTFIQNVFRIKQTDGLSSVIINIRSIRLIRVQKKTEHFVFKEKEYDNPQGRKL